MSMKVVCKECKQVTPMKKLCASSTQYLEEHGKYYVKDIKCSKCGRILIEGKEVPKDIVKRGLELRKQDMLKGWNSIKPKPQYTFEG